MACNGEPGNPGYTHRDRRRCPGCSVCHGDCESCGGTGLLDIVDRENITWDTSCDTYRKATP